MPAAVFEKRRHRVLEKRRLLLALNVVLPFYHVEPSFRRDPLGLAPGPGPGRTAIRDALVLELVPIIFRVFALVDVHRDYFAPFFGLPFGLFFAAISVRTSSSSASGTCFRRSLGVQFSAVHIRDSTDRSMLPCSPR